MNFSYDALSAMSTGMRREILSGELHRRVKTMDEVPSSDIDAVVNHLLALSLAEIVDFLHDPSRFASAVHSAQSSLSTQASRSTSEGRSSAAGRKSPSRAASADSRLLDPNVLAATASAPDHPSTPVSHSSPMSTPPRTSSPAPSAQPGGGIGASERDRLRTAVARLEPDSEKAGQITELLMSLTKRERAMCLFNSEVLKGKVADARLVLESDEGDQGNTVAEPTTPLRKSIANSSFEDSPQTPALSSRAPSAAASPAAPVTPPSKSVSTMLSNLSLGSSPSTSQNANEAVSSIGKLAQMPAARIVEVLMHDSATCDALGLSKPDAAVVSATDAFIDGLKGQAVPKQKQQLGDKLFRVVKNFGIKGAVSLNLPLPPRLVC